MKKLFICVMTSLCSTLAFADADLVVKPATITNGNGTMQVVINNTNTTAFQFDVKLPAGVSATAFTLTGAPESRKCEQAHYNANDNVWRFLSYDEGNAVLAEGATFNVTLAATNAAKTGVAETDNVLVVDQNGNGTEVDDASSAVTVENGVLITLPSKGATTLVSGSDLDFSDVPVKAYIVSGYDLESNNVMLTRVKDVPAETPIVIFGDASTSCLIPFTTSCIYYPENYLKGYSDASYPVDWSGKFINMRLNQGVFKGVDESVTAWDAGKCYLQIPATVTSAVSEAAVKVTTPSSGIKTYIGNYDLDFTSVDLKAYIVTGYDKNNIVWVTRVKKASANTPLLLWGESNKEYAISSSEQKLCYINMLRGDANNVTTITQEADGYLNMTMSKGQFKGLSVASAEVAAGQCYLPVPLSILPPATSRGDVTISNQIEEAEVIYIKLSSISGEDDGTTGIRSIDEGQFTNDVWYNLNGQRIDTPTKKGLYIKNGKKVLVK